MFYPDGFTIHNCKQSVRNEEKACIRSSIEKLKLNKSKAKAHIALWESWESVEPHTWHGVVSLSKTLHPHCLVLVKPESRPKMTEKMFTGT